MKQMKTKEYHDHCQFLCQKTTRNQHSWQTEINFSSSNPPGTLLSPVYNRMMCALADGGILAIESYKSCISYRELQVLLHLAAPKSRPTNIGKLTED